MSGPSATPEPLSAGLSSRALERGLDELAQRVRGDVEPLPFLTDGLRLLVHTARADRAAVWLRGGDQTWTRVGLSVQSADGAIASESSVAGPDWLAAALNQSGPEATRFTQDGQSWTRLAGPVRQGGQPTGVIEALWDGAVPQATLIPFLGAVCELTGDFLVQHELRMLRRERLEWKQWEQFQATLAETADLSRLAMVLTHDGRVMTGSDRVTVVRMQGLRARGESVSGVDVLDPRSTTLQALERVAQTAAKLRQPLWYTSNAPQTGPGLAACASLQQIASCQAIGAFPLSGGDGWIAGVLIVERFAEVTDFLAWQKRCETLARFAAPAWSANIERTLGWLGRWSRQRQRWAATTGRLLTAAVVLGGMAAALAVIPAEHVVVGEGQLLPERRRDVFASTSGLVSELRVQHGDEVTEGQPLVVLRDPQVELETARVVGELATVRTRLGVVQAARIAMLSSGTDSAIRAQQLTAEEEELKQRLESLARQQALFDEQQAQWELKSPLAGQVLTWDLESRLTGRPVERGQVLLTVGDIAGDWVIEARIRERDIGAVWSASNASATPVPIEFVTTLDMHTVRRGTLRELARTAEIDDRGDSTLRVTIAVASDQAGPLRPGATVLPRIPCGRKSLGYVWLHPLFDALRRQWWRW